MKKKRSRGIRKATMLCEEQGGDYGVRFNFLEFFAGGGMARAGLSKNWAPLWANDFCEKKAAVYRRNWGNGEMRVGDVAEVMPTSLPWAEMAWGSFPCQDLSLAGDQTGIGAAGDVDKTRSGTFWPFWRLMDE
ncbi:MAG: DNA cytosine methyltransferase, partial [Opitutaceae bacterium]|nr:DNA cytosine methyltransferase [Opitutaceae bacterium]